MSNLSFPNNIDASTFYHQIDEIVKKFEITYLDAVVYFCEKNNIEMETAAALIKSNFRIKSSIQNDGEQLNFLEKTAKLPI